MKDGDGDIYLFLCQTRKEVKAKHHTRCICCTSMVHLAADIDEKTVHNAKEALRKLEPKFVPHLILRESPSYWLLQKWEGNWAELTFTKTSGIVNGDAPVCYWPITLSPVTVPDVFAKVNSAKFPSRSWSCKLAFLPPASSNSFRSLCVS